MITPRKIKEYILNPNKAVYYIKHKRLHSRYGINLPDDDYIKKMFKLTMGYELDLNNPKTFNEKLNWLKLNDRKPEYSQMADKYSVKKYVSDRIGSEYVIPLLGVWDRFDDIDFNALPEKFVLKTTHDCGGVVVCQSKKDFDKAKAKKFLEKHLKFRYFYHCREWPYKNIKPRIIAEEFVKDGDNDFLPVYKLFCFGGEPKVIQVIQNDKQENESIDYFDTEWNLLPFRQNFPNSDIHLKKPDKLAEMLDIARKLAKDMKFIRVDLYSINNEIKFSEFTFYSDAGFCMFEPEKWDETLGGWINL